MTTLTRAGWLFAPMLKRFTVAIALSSIAVAVFIGTLGAASAYADSQAERPDGLGATALRSIELDSYGTSASPKELTTAAIESAGHLDHVQEITGWTQASVAIHQSSNTPAVGVALTSRVPAIQPVLTDGREPRGAGEVIVDSSTLHALHARVGDSVVLEHAKRALDGDGTGTGTYTPIRIVGVYDSAAASLDVPGTAYGAPDLLRLVVADDRGQSPAWFDQNYVYPKAYAVADSTAALGDVISEARTQGYSASSFASLLTGLTVTQQLMRSVSLIAIVALCVILTILAWVLGSAVLATRRGSIGLLIALGWTRRQVVGLFLCILIGIGGIIGAVGIIGGAVIATVVAMTTGIGFPTNWFVFLIAGITMPVLVFGITPLIPITRLARTSPDTTLRERIDP
ncbi:hypothetical protein LK09_12945 [Microbacterium mangrovi]|uniref:ABC3 transporter permease C-terminal domain-containing protein n=1 Tax=Microbacterium mangrovi TaxID=1348253 RepID=A0A0B2A607_9MICO|nr:FtsX-like permease family protein [Microbacterium mangrovi]KHK97164.1 hypothetical protein LK09_12945 [Microbacterium mangrovi]